MQIIIDIPDKLAYEGFERPFTEDEKNILIKAIGNGTPLKWIPVSEGMPKATNYYLIQHTRKYCNDEMAVAFYSVEEAHVDPNYIWEFVTDSDVQEVIAWMPLPALYEHKKGAMRNEKNMPIFN